MSKVCEELKNSDVPSRTKSSDEFGVKLFFAVKPMLSERLDVTDVHQLSANVTYHVEDKFDGERFQVNGSKNKLKTHKHT